MSYQHNLEAERARLRAAIDNADATSKEVAVPGARDLEERKVIALEAIALELHAQRVMMGRMRA